MAPGLGSIAGLHPSGALTRKHAMHDKPYEDLPESIADALLARLADDDAFRSLFASNPRAALAELGYGPALGNDQRGIWESLVVNQLADKSVFVTALAGLRQDVLNARAAADPVTLDQARG